MKSKITAENISKLESFTREVMERDKAVGLAIAAIDDRGNTLYQQFFGVRDKEKTCPSTRIRCLALPRFPNPLPPWGRCSWRRKT